MNAQVFLVYEIRRFSMIFQKISRKLKLKSNSLNLKIATLVGCCQNTLKDCDSFPKYDGLKPCRFRDLNCFMIYFLNFSENLTKKTGFEIPNIVAGLCEGTVIP